MTPRPLAVRHSTDLRLIADRVSETSLYAGLVLMIHYTCDRCRREIDPARQTRYVVEIETQAAVDGPLGEFDDEVDHLSELNQLLEATGEEELAPDLAEASHRGRYDLCPECHRQFLKNPLGRDAMLAFGFSNN